MPTPHRRRRTERSRSSRLWRAVLGLVLGGLAAAWMPVLPTLSVALPPLQRAPASDGLDWLSTDSQQHIVDSQGRTVLLRGFNSEALLDYPWGPPSPLQDSDAAAMQQSGFDVVRLPVAWSRLEPQRGHFDTAYLDLVDSTVQLLNRHRLWVVLDMHFLDWGPRFGGSGAPEWAAVPGVPDWGFGLPDPYNKHSSPATFSATAYLFMSTDWQDDFQQAWRFVAARFRDRSGIAGYDLYNEPHSMPIPPRIFERDFLFPLYARTIASIGTVDPNHLFILEGILFTEWGTLVIPMQARGLVWSTHTYSGSLIPPLFTGDPTFLQHRLQQEAGEAAQLPGPYWNGELGISWGQAHAGEWADAALQQLDALGAGWAWWQWRQGDNWGVVDEHGVLHRDRLAHLAMPYLVESPGGISVERGAGHALIVHATAAAEFDVGVPALLQNDTVQGDCAQASASTPGRLQVRVSGACTFTVVAA